MQISFTKRKVHYLYLVLAIVSMLLAIVSYARAQETTVDQIPPEQAVRENGKPAQRGLNVEQQNRFINLVRNVYDRMDGAITRLEGIVDRIEARVAILESQGIDTALALSPLGDAKNKLAEAKSALAQAKASAETSIVSDTPKERFATVRNDFVNIRQAIRDSYILLREALAELKDAVIEANLNNNGVSDAVTDPEPASEEEVTN